MSLVLKGYLVYIFLPMIVKKKQLLAFKKIGMIEIKNFLDKKEVKFYNQEIQRLSKSKNKKIAKYYQQNYLGTKNDLFRIEHFFEISKKMRRLINSSKVKKIVNLLCGKKTILFKEKINIKPPFSREDRLHQDVQGDWLKYSNNFVTFLVSLVDTDKKNGNLVFDISGKNKSKILGDMFKVLKTSKLSAPNFQNFPLKAGDAIFFNGYIPHKSTKNNTHKSRKQMYITYCVPKLTKTREKYFLEKFNNCPPNQRNNSKFVFKN
jgi:ectoine hydroxylase-related dioxygenase (phytanoyl-CoA dioxygenase family)